MKNLGHLAALAALGCASAAQAQDAGAAFGCTAPYRNSMLAVGALEVLGQTPVKAFPTLHGDGQLITFAPGGTLVHGAKPDKLSLEMLEPERFQNPKKFRMTFAAVFARTPANDAAIQRSVEWHITCGALPYCQRASASQPAGAGRLEYFREAELTLKCIFEFTPEEVEAFGN